MTRPAHKPRHQADPTADVSKSMPFSMEAEQAILSCCLHSPIDILNDAQASIPVESFYHPANRTLYETMLELRSMNLPVEYIGLSQHLQDKGLISKIGGHGVLAELLDFIPTPAHYGQYKGILRDKLLARRVVDAGVELTRAGYDYHEPGGLVTTCDGVLSRLNSELRGASPMKSWKDELNEFESHWTEQLHGRQRSAIPSRWREWDATFGGIRPEFHVFKGKTSHGKTSLGLNVLKTVAIDNNEPSIWFPFEMSKGSLIKRLIADMESIDTRCLFSPDMFKPSRDEMNRISRAKERLEDAPVMLVKELEMGTEFIASKCRAFAAKHGRIGLIGIDYLQKIPHPKWGNRNDNSSDRLSYNNDQCFKLQQEMGCAMIMISSTNADGGTLGSQGADYDTDVAVEVDRNTGITVKKNRNGGGVGSTIKLRWNGSNVRFESQDHMP